MNTSHSPLFVAMERDRVKSQLADLRSWEEERISTRSPTVLSGNRYSASVTLSGRESDGRTNCCIHLSATDAVPPLFQELVCGLKSEQRGLEQVARTGRSGAVWFSLGEGEYSFQFVSEVRNEIDVEMLAQLAIRGDERAVWHLAAASSDTRLPESVKEYLQERHSAIGSHRQPNGEEFTTRPPREFAVGIATEQRMINLDDGRERRLAPGKAWGLSDDGTTIMLDLPFDDGQDAGQDAGQNDRQDHNQNAVFPYGCALLRYRAADGQIVSHALIPVERNRHLRKFQAMCPVSRLLPTGTRRIDAQRIDLIEVTAHSESRRTISSTMVESLFQRLDVQRDSDCYARLSRLKLERMDEEKLE